MKPQLTARLTKALKTEEADAINECNADDSNQAKTSDYSADYGSNDGMEIDLADILILDEYDSTKDETKQEEREKKVSESPPPCILHSSKLIFTLFTLIFPT